MRDSRKTRRRQDTITKMMKGVETIAYISIPYKKLLKQLRAFSWGYREIEAKEKLLSSTIL